ncbi:caspase family protein [Acaryochloris sp. IP29b_bin.137]|uniref:WD40 domain-containing protein n=1 Tax=Acaryochloris sp. IP29b_bin.137 TaxID=2969217 RepID=UPI002619C11F|nr:caspase family protein [Acaryochloris sp. IP29b_bin.137]
MFTLELDQLIYTSFPDQGFQTLSSESVSEEVKQVFLTQVVYKYWNSYAPPQPGYRSAYLAQISTEQTLFGWMYNHGNDDLGRSHVPYFVAYCLTGKLDNALLDDIYTYLERGPITFIERESVSPVVAKVVIDSLEDWHPALPGVSIPSGTRARCRLLLDKEKLLSFSVAVPADNQIEVDLEDSTDFDVESGLLGLPTDSEHEPLVNSLERLLESPRITLDSMARVPTTKNALLIGVSHCEYGFEPLPGVQQDIAVMKQVLENPKIAAFDEVQTLLNPNPQLLAESLESFCQDRDIDDLLLVYFSGHGVVLDEQGRFGLTTGVSRTNPQDKVVRSTLVSVDLLQDILNDCKAEQQVVLLDCCYRQTASSVLAHHLDNVNFPQHLGGLGRTIMTSATQARHAFVHKGADLSSYTFYLVEGLRTGAADQNCDGIISIEEWYAYAKRKVKQEIPALDPQVFNIKAAQNLALAQSPAHEPQFIYRRQFESYSMQGEVSPVNRVILDNLRASLDLDVETAKVIEEEVNKPKRTYQTKLQEYAMAFVEAIRQEYPVSSYLQEQFRHFQATLGLTDADTIPVETAIIRQVQVIQSPSQATDVTRGTVPSPSWPNQNVMQPFQQAIGFGQQTFQTSAHRLTVLGQSFSSKVGHYLRNNRHRVKVPKVSWHQLEAVPKRVWWGAGAGAIALLILTTVLRQQQESQQRQKEAQQLSFLQSLSQQKRYDTCISQTQAISKDSRLYPHAQQLLSQCQAGIDWKKAQLQTLPNSPKKAIWSVALSPDGKTLMGSGDQNDIKLWNMGKGQLVRTLSDHKDKVWTIALGPKGKILASASGDCTIKLWDVATGKLLRTFAAHPATVWSVAISPDGKFLVSGSEDQTLKVWDIKTGKLVRTLTGHASQVRAVAISPNGQMIASASADQTVKLWELKTGKLIRTLKGHSERVISIAFSPSSTQLASASQDKTVKLWTLASGELKQTFKAHTKPVTAVTFSPDGQTLATGSHDRTVKLWNLSSGRLRHTLGGYNGDIYSLAFAADGQSLVSSSKNSAIKVWHRN